MAQKGGGKGSKNRSSGQASGLELSTWKKKNENNKK